MNFEKMWHDQKEFNAKLVDIDQVFKDLHEFRKWNNFYCLALHREISELLETVDWKIHRNEYKQPIRSNTLEELVDCLKYLMCLAQLHGFSPEEIEQEYWRKSAVVEQLHKQEIENNIKESGKKVIGVDIDGVLADYPRSFVQFINEELGTYYMLEDVTSYNIYESLGIPLEKGLELKDKYRQTGQKRFIPLCEGAKEFLDWAREQDYAVVLLTARPYQQYKRIFADTMEWLKSNELHYDMVLFSENKEETLINQFQGQVEFFVEDMPKNANQVARLGVPCYLITRPYNKDSQLNGLVIRTDSLQEVMEHATGHAYKG